MDKQENKRRYHGQVREACLKMHKTTQRVLFFFFSFFFFIIIIIIFFFSFFLSFFLNSTQGRAAIAPPTGAAHAGCQHCLARRHATGLVSRCQQASGLLSALMFSSCFLFSAPLLHHHHLPFIRRRGKSSRGLATCGPCCRLQRRRPWLPAAR